MNVLPLHIRLAENVKIPDVTYLAAPGTIPIESEWRSIGDVTYGNYAKADRFDIRWNSAEDIVIDFDGIPMRRLKDGFGTRRNFVAHNSDKRTWTSIELRIWEDGPHDIIDIWTVFIDVPYSVLGSPI